MGGQNSICFLNFLTFRVLPSFPYIYTSKKNKEKQRLPGYFLCLTASSRNGTIAENLTRIPFERLHPPQLGASFEVDS